MIINFHSKKNEMIVKKREKFRVKYLLEGNIDVKYYKKESKKKSELQVCKLEVALMVERLLNSCIITEYDLLRAKYEKEFYRVEMYLKELEFKTALRKYLISKINIDFMLNLYLNYEEIKVIDQCFNDYWECSEQLQIELIDEVKSYNTNSREIIDKLDQIDKFQFNIEKGLGEVKSKYLNTNIHNKISNLYEERKITIKPN